MDDISIAVQMSQQSSMCNTGMQAYIRAEIDSPQTDTHIQEQRDGESQASRVWSEHGW